MVCIFCDVSFVVCDALMQQPRQQQPRRVSTTTWTRGPGKEGVTELKDAVTVLLDTSMAQHLHHSKSTEGIGTGCCSAPEPVSQSLQDVSPGRLLATRRKRSVFLQHVASWRSHLSTKFLRYRRSRLTSPLSAFQDVVALTQCFPASRRHESFLVTRLSSYRPAALWHTLISCV